MRSLFLSIAVGLLVSVSTASAARHSEPTPVCEVIRNAPKLIGKRLTVEGYITNLGSHGFALTGRRRDCIGALFLWTDHVGSLPTWRSAFANSLGPKRAVLVGTVKWQQSRFEGGRHNPALAVERIEYLSRADAKGF